MIVLLDTNFLTMPEQFKIDIMEEIKKIVTDAEIKTIQPVVSELKSMKTNASRVALSLIKATGIEVIKKTGRADDALLETALETGAIVATNDKELRKTAESKKIKVIFMRKKKTLEISGGGFFV